MIVQDLFVGRDQLWSGAAPISAPCLFIGAHDSGGGIARVGLPPCPLIAIGDRSGEAAGIADCVVAGQPEAEILLANITANPRAAQVTVDLLRLTHHLAPEQGLVAESMAYGLLQGSAEHQNWLAGQPDSRPVNPEGKVQTERHDNVLTVTLDRPASDNAIDRAMRDGLSEALQLAALDDTISRVALRGAGRSFSLGAELGEFGTTSDPAIAHQIRRHTLPAFWALRCADKLETHVQGACIGAGLEIAAFSSRITASRRAWFQLPELTMGIVPGAGGCVSLTRRIGRQRTAELILSGKRLSAREALDWGLIDAIVD